MKTLASFCCIFLMAAMPLAVAHEAGFSTGTASVTNSGLFDCGPRARVSAVGIITAEDKMPWVVPAKTHFKTAPKAADLYNECSGTEMDRLSKLDLASIPLRDAGGREEFVAYIFADNYFEFYANGKLLAVDPVPFTPFNSNVIRFKANRPFSLALTGHLRAIGVPEKMILFE